MDLPADTCVASANVLVVHNHDNNEDMYGFEEDHTLLEHDHGAIVHPTQPHCHLMVSSVILKLDFLALGSMRKIITKYYLTSRIPPLDPSTFLHSS